MSTVLNGGVPTKVLADKAPPKRIPWRAIVPIAVAAVLALLPAPGGLPQHAWQHLHHDAGF